MARVGTAVLAMALSVAPAASWAKDPAYAAYRAEVRKHTEKSYTANKALIDPSGERGKASGKDLDHIKPVKQCFLTGQSASSCGAASNLRVIDAGKNRSEGCRAAGCRTLN
ncbi:MAG: hypothetical protein J0H82_06030 [Alphaproteobacteria bacterium]|jgi:hypothetical protein|nr:hypothetical protein [Alphaproteobacteria bacterium]